MAFRAFNIDNKWKGREQGNVLVFYLCTLSVLLFILENILQIYWQVKVVRLCMESSALNFFSMQW